MHDFLLRFADGTTELISAPTAIEASTEYRYRCAERARKEGRPAGYYVPRGMVRTEHGPECGECFGRPVAEVETPSDVPGFHRYAEVKS